MISIGRWRLRWQISESTCSNRCSQSTQPYSPICMRSPLAIGNREHPPHPAGWKYPQNSDEQDLVSLVPSCNSFLEPAWEWGWYRTWYACSLSWLDQESSLPSHTLYMQQFANVQVLMSAMNDSMREEAEELWGNITEVCWHVLPISLPVEGFSWQAFSFCICTLARQWSSYIP